jgi:hypothetical protein
MSIKRHLTVAPSFVKDLVVIDYLAIIADSIDTPIDEITMELIQEEKVEERSIVKEVKLMADQDPFSEAGLFEE